MAKPTASTNGMKSDPTIDELADQISKLKSDLSELTATLSDYGSAKTDEAKRAARARAESMRDAGTDRFHEAQDQANHFVRTQPATAIGIAAGVGFLVGMLTTGRR